MIRSATEAENIARFKKNAAAAGATVLEMQTLREALGYAVDLCRKKPLRQPLMDEPPAPREGKRGGKIMAAPGLDAQNAAFLDRLGLKEDLLILRKGLRAYPSGIDLGLVLAEKGIAESASCLVKATDEDVRLATMICEISLIVLKKSDIAAVPHDCAAFLAESLSGKAAHLSWISGPSKTSDIERVLAIGVHGPLELHIALVQG
ncbi:MAG: lactate utilization protein [Deltaproteobacteria bacterium]|jgi:L-lactate dehydrogenase complex protein LldG|nr:lactate utilization protein [Deltaproteobacteria bacterium]